MFEFLVPESAKHFLPDKHVIHRLTRFYIIPQNRKFFLNYNVKMFLMLIQLGH